MTQENPKTVCPLEGCVFLKVSVARTTHGWATNCLKKKNSTSGHWAIGGMHPDPGYIQILTMLTEPPIQMEPLFSQEGARLVMERVVTLVAALVSPA